MAGKYLTKDEIERILNEHRAFLREQGVLRLGLFGSYVRGTAGPDSDIDLLVELGELTFDRYMDLKFFLEDLFQIPVDLVLADSIKPRLRSSILNEIAYVSGL